MYFIYNKTIWLRSIGQSFKISAWLSRIKLGKLSHTPSGKTSSILLHIAINTVKVLQAFEATVLNPPEIFL